jgi:Fe2+ or Zn2+ uptake regulation protein
MIVCSCTVITDRDIEGALLEILGAPDAPIPTPGIVYRHLSKRMNCCSCAPLAVATIYNKVDELEKKGLISPTLSATTRSKLLEFTRTTVPRTMTKNSESAAQTSEDNVRDVA